jgi:hypothetical protein
MKITTDYIHALIVTTNGGSRALKSVTVSLSDERHLLTWSSAANPDLPVTFVTESLASMAEPHEQATPFIPRSRKQ